MAQSSAAARGEVASLVREAAAGRCKPVYLFIGESFETGSAAHALIDALVSPAHRAFNLESYDGRTTPIATVINSLRTPGFFPGTKIVWLRDSQLLPSDEKRPELTRALLTAWNQGRTRDAAEKLVRLAALAGWSQAQFARTRWATLAATRVREVFGRELPGEQLAQLDAVHAACGARDLAVAAYRNDSGVLLEWLESGPPPHAVLLLTAAAVDARKRLFKRLREVGAVVSLNPARERSGMLSRDTVDDVVRTVVNGFAKQLAGGARELILRRAGTETALLTAELEKLCLYVGERTTITEDDVRQVVRDMAESWIFDFTSALAARHVERALPLLRGLIEQGEPPLRLLAMIARELRMLLLARECLDETLQGKWGPRLPFATFQTRILPHLDPETVKAFGKAHPFVLYRRFQDASHTDRRLLREALVHLSNLDLRLKSSQGEPGTLLEIFVMQWCRGTVPRDRWFRGARLGSW
ncbi:MAG: DNA polymerase III subunit delta [Candidatus Binatia bacterium]